MVEAQLTDNQQVTRDKKNENINNFLGVMAIFGVTGDIYSKRREMGYTYVTTNYLTDEVYIGKSEKEPHENSNYLGSGLKLKKQIKEYGKENFYKQIIDENVPEDFLDELEIMRIAEHREILGTEMVLNIAEGGSGGNTLMGKSDEEVFEIRKKQVATLKEGYKSGRLVPSMLGKTHSPTTIKKLSDSKLGEKNPQFEKVRTEEEKEHLRKINIEINKNPENREKRNVFLNLDEQQREERLKVWSESKKRGKNGRAKTVQDLETGKIFDCLRTACDELGLNINTEKWRRANKVSRLVDCPSCDG